MPLPASATIMITSPYTSIGPQEGLSVAENFLYSVRHDNQFTQDEARLLDLCLVLHMEHGGGNNSAFACRVLVLLGHGHLLRHRRGGGLAERAVSTAAPT